MRTALSFAAVLALLVPSIAFADATPPEEMACIPNSMGYHCDGTCVKSTCSRLDYGHPDDAGVPGTMTYECYVCVGSDAGMDAGQTPSEYHDVVARNDDSTSGCGSVSKRSGAELGALAVASCFSFLLLLKRRRTRS